MAMINLNSGLEMGFKKVSKKTGKKKGASPPTSRSENL